MSLFSQQSATRRIWNGIILVKPVMSVVLSESKEGLKSGIAPDIWREPDDNAKFGALGSNIFSNFAINPKAATRRERKEDTEN
jgi:hypothetical protein